MRPPSQCSGRPSLLKRKRTLSGDEDVESDRTVLQHSMSPTPAEGWGPPSELSEGDVADGLLSPDSIPSSELGLGSPPCLGSLGEELNASDAGELPTSDSEGGRSSSVCSTLSPAPPVPPLTWADSRHVWDMMCAKDIASHNQRDKHLFLRHPGLTPRMRSILLDWLIEVCEVYKLHRQTYHLCMDYIDRYLSRQRNVPKQQLQLIGISCLFIAAKVEEIYPPKVKEFAYVTDGACTEEEITDKELVILKVLQWGLGPVTALGWLSVYLQTLSHLQQQQIHQRQAQHCSPSPASEASSPGTSSTQSTFGFYGTGCKEHAFELPQLSGPALCAAAALLDLCMLDEGSLRFRYAALAAAALAHTCGRELTICVSGLQWDEVSPCASWMQPFAEVLHEACPSALVGIPAPLPWDSKTKGVADDSHNIQVHAVDLRLLERAQQRIELATTSSVDESPVAVAPGLLTPPASGKKLPATRVPAATASHAL